MIPFALFYFTVAVSDIHKSNLVSTWPVVKGKIVETYIDCGRYCITVKYEYSVDGINHLSDKVNPSTYGEDYYFVERKYDYYYPVNKIVDVYYNRENPSESYLTLSISSNIPPLIFSSSILILYVGVFIVLIRKLITQKLDQNEIEEQMKPKWRR